MQYSTNYQRFLFHTLAFFSLLFYSSPAVEARSARYRCMWRDDPATTMVIGWEQVSGHSPMIYLSETDYGQDVKQYTVSMKPSYSVVAKGMNNQFARLQNLRPNTTYYFIIVDSEGVSPRMSFQTAPNIASERLSIIAGGDSRNYRDSRRRANSLVGKLKPHFVLFNGDMTGGDSDREWQEWLDDWQLTITSEGRLTPVLVSRGNHEITNKVLVDIFDVKSTDVYYALTFGGDLLRVYTLNSMIPAGGSQRDWLEQDLKDHSHIMWKIAQYHIPIRPHTRDKAEKNDQYMNWAKLFYNYGVNYVMESDAHVVKTTWPIRPSTEPGSSEGFIRDDHRGTVYAGEGGWGAPLRNNNDDKSWTRNSGSFNQFKWLFVDEAGIEMRTIKTDEAEQVAEVSLRNRFQIPIGLNVWRPDNGDVVRIQPRLLAANSSSSSGISATAIAAKAPLPKTTEETTVTTITPDASGKIKVKYDLAASGEVVVHLIDTKMQEVKRYTFQHGQRGTFSQECALGSLPKGSYKVIVKCNQKVIGRYELSI